MYDTAGQQGRDTDPTAKLDEIAKLVRQKVDADQADEVQRFVRCYYQHIPPADLERRSVADLYGAALAHWNLGWEREPGSAVVRVYTPELEQHGWQSTHSVAEIVTDDMPFLVDSVTMVLTQQQFGIHLVVHPVVPVRRDDGRFVGLGDPDDDAVQRESYLRVEFDRQTDAERLDALRDDLVGALADVRVAVEDWQPMRSVLREVIEELDAHDAIPCADDEIDEIRAFLQWLHDDNFTFLGFRSYDLVDDDDETVLRSVPDSGLGILRQDRHEATSKSFAKLPPEVRRRAREPNLLMLTKANSRATVHRPAYLDYIGLKRFDEAGEVIGERRFLGLYTSAAYYASPTRMPLLRRKVEQVLERSGARAGSHDYKEVLAILERYPRDELFQTPVDDLFRIARGIHHLQERRQVRLFLRRDTYGRFFSCLVYLPRDRYNTTTRLAMQRILTDALDGRDLDYGTRVSESVLARLHFVIHTHGQAPTEVDEADLERQLAEATRDWTDDLEEALVELRGEEAGIERFRRYGHAFPPGYRTDTAPRLAVRDIDRLDALDESQPMQMTLYHPIEAPPHRLRFKLYHRGAPIPLSTVLPVLENLGVEVRDQRPYQVEPEGGETAWIYDFGLDSRALGGLDTDSVTRLFTDAFSAVWDGHAEDDSFNQLVLSAALGWREVAVLRAYARYLRQVGTQFSQMYMAEILAAHGELSRLLVRLFRHRFEPVDGDGEHTGDERAAAVAEDVRRRLDALPSLDEDRILRGFLRLIEATVRTNFCVTRPDGSHPPHLSFKLDPSTIPGLPEPRPASEIWVYSPRAEGVHLRSGRVARGGIRWSDRREDFRTEILGLMKAQRIKNAVILPTGAKGGFVVKQPPRGDRDELQREVVACYRTLMEGMLDLTDNLVDSDVVPPDDVVRHDGDDPYLVVAADKGTASFSDIANEVAEEYGFWLGDAYASGGSVGFDHKEMGITARGAWESVRRHFSERGIDVQQTEITAVGIGDMSGDVFGNGMLLSRHLRLVAAFDHRHLFLDPDPDPEASYQERQRLFEQDRSSWDDYDPEALSPGGGVFERDARSVPISEEVAARFDLDADELSPTDLIRHLLCADVDLLWNGGIGTYVKASTETHADVGDKANDSVRVDATDLRCDVIGEGGNLGVTQRGRVEFALAGGSVNTDAIDNSAGVDTSDHEVNIKILLNQVVDAGDLTVKQRNELIAGMTQEVAESVLRDTAEQNQALSSSVTNADSMVRVHRRYLRFLESEGLIDRELEALPDEETLAERASEGGGLTRPEFAVLLPSTKNWLQDRVLASDTPDEPELEHYLTAYFPDPLPERFPEQMCRHRLRRQLIATQLVNDVVDRSGTTFVFRLMDETGAEPPEIVRGHAAAAALFGLDDLWHETLGLDGEVAATTRTAMVLEARRLVERATRWLLRHRSRPLPISETVEALQAAVREVTEALPEALVGSDHQDAEARRERLLDEGVAGPLAQRVAGFRALFSALDIAEAARHADEPAGTATHVYFGLADRLELSWVRDRMVELPRESRWEALARDALRDDLYQRHAALTLEVLDSTEPSAEPGARIDEWVEHHAGAVERCRRVIGDVRSSGRESITTLTVALRELRNIVEASS